MHATTVAVDLAKDVVNKSDRTDTEGVLEVGRCGGIQPVPVQTVEQQELQALHRVRTQWQATRTARITVIRGLLREREQGIPIARGARTARARGPLILEDAELPLPGHLRHTLAARCDEVRAAEHRVTELDRVRARLAAAHPVARRLLTIPGIGIITATALVGAVAHIHACRRARHVASWLGLTPSERSSGLRRDLGRISKRGDVYRRLVGCSAG